MTVKEFYEFCKKNHAEDFDLQTAVISKYGCYIGQAETEENNVHIDYDDATVNL